MKRVSDNSLTRREFIKVAGVAAAGMMASQLIASPAFSAVSARVLGANDKIRVGFIGVGGQGTRHVQAVKHLAESLNVEPVAVCDIWAKRTATAAREAGLPESKIYTDYRKLLEDKDVDAVLIGTPEHWHYKIASDALESGRHCYIEKPMTRTLDEALRLREIAQRTKGVVQVGSQGCSAAIWTRANELISSGKIGKTVWSQGSYCRNNPDGEWNYGIDPEATEQTVDWKAWLGDCKARPWSPEIYFRWRKYADFSAGIISDLFPHRLHPLMIAIGPEYPKRVSCLGTIVCQPDREVADNTQMIVEFPSGSTMVLAGSTCNEQGLEDLIRGNKATIYFGGNKIDIRPERPYTDEIDPLQEQVEGPDGSVDDHWRSFFNAIRTNSKPSCDIELATKVQVIVSLGEMSWKEGKTMNFDPETLKVV